MRPSHKVLVCLVDGFSLSHGSKHIVRLKPNVWESMGLFSQIWMDPVQGAKRKCHIDSFAIYGISKWNKLKHMRLLHGGVYGCKFCKRLTVRTNFLYKPHLCFCVTATAPKSTHVFRNSTALQKCVYIGKNMFICYSMLCFCNGMHTNNFFQDAFS